MTNAQESLQDPWSPTLHSNFQAFQDHSPSVYNYSSNFKLFWPVSLQ